MKNKTKFTLLIITISMLLCTQNRFNTAEKDYSNGVIRIYKYGELFDYESLFSRNLKKFNIEYYHLNQSDLRYFNQNEIAGYNNFMETKIAEKYGPQFLDSLLQVSKEQ